MLEYFKYLLVGGVVAIIALILQAILFTGLTESQFSYAVSIVVIYPVGIVLSYILQKKYTFDGQEKFSSKQLCLFAVGALCVASLAAIIAWVIKYPFGLHARLGNYSSTVAFFLSMIPASMLNFIYNKKMVFGK